MVVNGACKEKDLAHISKVLGRLGYAAKIEHETEKSLLALQGPKAASVLQSFTDVDLKKLPFMHQLEKPVVINGVDCTVTRCGYTGEDGFEISVSNEHGGAERVATELAAHSDVLPCGLGARDSLRVEAGLCLYGNDIDEERSVVEAGLIWVVSKPRRERIKAFLDAGKTEEVDPRFLGSELVLGQVAKKPSHKRVGLLIAGAPAREQCDIYDETGDKKIGIVTSGTFSPS